MRGHNSLTLCIAEMNAAMEHYLNTVIFKDDQRVIVKKVAESGDNFIVKFSEQEPEK